MLDQLTKPAKTFYLLIQQVYALFNDKVSDVSCPVLLKQIVLQRGARPDVQKAYCQAGCAITPNTTNSILKKTQIYS